MMISRVTGCSDSGRRGDQLLRREIALGDPRPFVEQPRGLVERLDVDLDNRGAERCEARDRGLELRGRHLIAEEHALALDRHADAQAGGIGPGTPSGRLRV